MIGLIFFSSKERPVRMSAFIKKTSFAGFIFALTFCHQALTSERVIGPSAFLKAFDEEIRRITWRRMFHNAAAEGDIETLNQLKFRVNVDAKDSEGKTAIHYASANDQVEALRVLVNELGANIEARDNLHQTAVFITIKDNRLQTLRVLVSELGANIKEKSYGQMSSLQFAELKENWEALEILANELKRRKDSPCAY